MSGADQVSEVVLRRVRLPLRQPLRSAHGVESVRELVVVEIRDQEGVSGYGECSTLARPTYTSEYTNGAWLVLRDHLAPAAIAGEPSGVVGHPMAAAAMEMALSDLKLRRVGRSLVDRVASRLGAPRLVLPRCSVIGRGEVGEVLAAVAEQVDAGVAAVKVKVTPRRQDMEVVRAVRAAFPSLSLAVDGNGSLDQRSVSMLAELDLSYVEQPAPADDLVASAKFQNSIDTPIALDESVTSVAGLNSAAALGAGRVLNVKPARLGGVAAAIDVIQRAVDLDWVVFVGGMLESGVGRAAALAVAASPLCQMPTDLGPSNQYFDSDLCQPITVDDRGLIQVPTGLGIGVDVDQEALESATTDMVVLT